MKWPWVSRKRAAREQEERVDALIDALAGEAAEQQLEHDALRNAQHENELEAVRVKYKNWAMSEQRDAAAMAGSVVKSSDIIRRLRRDVSDLRQELKGKV